MRVKRSTYFTLFLLLVALFVVIRSVTFGRWEAIVLPLFFGSIILILATVELTREFRSKDKMPTAMEGETEEKAKTKIEFRRFRSGLGWVLGFSLVIYLLGFLIAMPLFVITYLRVYVRGWVIAIVMATSITAVMYGMFEFGLRAPLYRGVIWELIFL